MVKYRFYRNKIIILIRFSKKFYYYNFFEMNMSNIKNIWKGINFLINRKMRGDNVIIVFKCFGNGGLLYNVDEIFNIMNLFFFFIGFNLVVRIF